jgi:DNA polymerase-1
MLLDSPAQAPLVFIIDLSNLAHRSFYANKDLTTSQGLPSGHVYGCARMLIALFRDIGEDICTIFCYDGLNAKAKRQEILDTYKGNRTPHIINPVEGAKELVINLPGLHIEKEGFEGDDAIAWAVNLVKPKNTIIYSGDKDLQALMRYSNVKCYSPNKQKAKGNGFIEPTDWLDEYHVTNPAKIYLAKALFGDPSDNIKGIDRLIKKQVEPILNDGKCVDISSFYDMLQTKPDSMTQKMYDKTIEGKDRIFINYQVILPRIDGFDKAAVKRVIKNDANKAGLLEVLKKYECVSVFNEASELYR